MRRKINDLKFLAKDGKRRSLFHEESSAMVKADSANFVRYRDTTSFGHEPDRRPDPR